MKVQKIKLDKVETQKALNNAGVSMTWASLEQGRSHSYLGSCFAKSNGMVPIAFAATMCEKHGIKLDDIIADVEKEEPKEEQKEESVESNDLLLNAILIQLTEIKNCLIEQNERTARIEQTVSESDERLTEINAHLFRMDGNIYRMWKGDRYDSEWASKGKRKY